MKALLTPLLTLTVGLAHAQVTGSAKLPIDSVTHRITYAEVVQLPGLSQAELYTRAKLWFAEAFKSGKQVIQTDDKEAGVVQGKAWTSVEVHFLNDDQPASVMGLWYTVTLTCRRGHYRYEITEFKSSIADGSGEQSPMEPLLASWAPRSDQDSTEKLYYTLVTGDLTTGIRSNGKGIAISMKEAMAHKPGSTASGKDW
jgi:hypothetical protein